MGAEAWGLSLPLALTLAVVLDLLLGLARRARGSMLVATHSATVAAMADRALRVHDGRE